MLSRPFICTFHHRIILFRVFRHLMRCSEISQSCPFCFSMTRCFFLSPVEDIAIIASKQYYIFSVQWVKRECWNIYLMSTELTLQCKRCKWNLNGWYQNKSKVTYWFIFFNLISNDIQGRQRCGRQTFIFYTDTLNMTFLSRGRFASDLFVLWTHLLITCHSQRHFVCDNWVPWKFWPRQLCLVNAFLLTIKFGGIFWSTALLYVYFACDSFISWMPSICHLWLLEISYVAAQLYGRFVCGSCLVNAFHVSSMALGTFFLWQHNCMDAFLATVLSGGPFVCDSPTAWNALFATVFALWTCV